MSQARHEYEPGAEWPSGIEVLARGQHVQPATDPVDLAAGMIPGAGRFSPEGDLEQVAAELAAVFSTVT